MTIRPCTNEDLPFLYMLYQQLHAGETGMTLADLTMAFARMRAHPGCDVFVAEHGDWVVGTFVLYILPNMTHNGRPAAILENIVVEVAYRGQGIGRAMLEYARELAQAHGCYKLSVTSNAVRTEAHAFYRRCGMEQHGVSFRYEL